MTELPRDHETERIVLGTLLVYPELFPTLADRIKDRLFHAPTHLRVYHAIRDAASNGHEPDAVAIVQHLDGREDKVAAWELVQYASPKARNLDRYVQRLEEEETKRSVLRAGYEMLDLAKHDLEPATIAALLEGIAKNVRNGHRIEPNLDRVDLTTVLDDYDADPIPWAVRGWFAENECAILAGEWGSGKSLVALDLAVSLAAGVPWMGYAEVTRPFRVLYVDEENSPKLARHRLRQILNGRKIQPGEVADLGLVYLTRNGINLDVSEKMAALRAEIEAHQPDFLFLDSLVRFFRGRSENDNSDMSAFFSERIRVLMRDYNLGVLLLDHMRKPGKGDDDAGHRVRGASDKPGFADELYLIQGDREQATRTLSHEKTRWDDLQPPVQTSWRKSEDGTAAWVHAESVERGAETEILRIVTAASTDGICYGDLAEAVTARGFADRHVKREIGKLHGQGTLRKAKASGRRMLYFTAENAPFGAS